MNEPNARDWNSLNSLLQWLAPILMLMILGGVGIWIRSIESEIAETRRVEIRDMGKEIECRSSERFYGATDGKVLQTRIEGLSERLVRIERKQDQILELLRN